MITVAITGGIGSGKSTVTSYLMDKGYIVVDADKIAKEMTSAGGRAIPYIVEHFGRQYIDNKGNMDRDMMRDLIFNNPEAKYILEEGTTKKVLEEIQQIKIDSEKNGVKVLFFDIPLLFECNIAQNYDYVWYIHTGLEERKRRIKERDGLDDAMIDAVINSQIDEKYKLEHSDCIIDNNGTIDDLHFNVDSLLKELKI